MKIPCPKICPDRSAECHISCEIYKTFRKQLDKENAEKHKRNDIICGYNVRKKTLKDIREFKKPTHYKGGDQ